MGGCLMRTLYSAGTVIVILAVALWLLNSPESAAGLIGLGFDLAAKVGDSFGVFMNHIVADVDGLF